MATSAYTGITPIVLGEKCNAASYPSFDFTNTWSIAEGTDEPRLVPLTVFTDFLDGCYLPLGTKPDADVNGIPAEFFRGDAIASGRELRHARGDGRGFGAVCRSQLFVYLVQMLLDARFRKAKHAGYVVVRESARD